MCTAASETHGMNKKSSVILFYDSCWYAFFLFVSLSLSLSLSSSHSLSLCLLFMLFSLITSLTGTRRHTHTHTDLWSNCEVEKVPEKRTREQEEEEEEKEEKEEKEAKSKGWNTYGHYWCVQRFNRTSLCSAMSQNQVWNFFPVHISCNEERDRLWLERWNIENSLTFSIDENFFIP